MKYVLAGVAFVILGVVFIPLFFSVATDCRPTRMGSDLRQISQALVICYYDKKELPESVIEGMKVAGMTDEYFIKLAQDPNFTYLKPTDEQLKAPATEIQILTYQMPDGKYVGYLDGHIVFLEASDEEP